MNRAIRRVGAFLILIFGILIFYFSFISIFKYEQYADDPQNDRQERRLFSQPLGNIVTSDGKVVAESVYAGDVYYRKYTDGQTYKDVVGYNTSLFGSFGIEENYQDMLAGHRQKDPGPYGTGLIKRKPNKVILTINSKMQEAAFEALGDQNGSIVMVDIRSGEIVAMVSKPGYDPSGFSDPNDPDSAKYFNGLRASKDKPFISRSYAELYPLGSVFKIVTAGAALRSGRYEEETQFSDTGKISLPLSSSTIRNFDGKSYGDISLMRSFEVSANTTFAKIGMEIGAELLSAEAKSFGFNRELGFELDHALSFFPEPGKLDKPGTALSAIGQKDVRATPLHAALIASAIANEGIALRPILVRSVTDDDGIELFRSGRSETFKVTLKDTARRIAAMMEGVVENGTGIRAKIPNIKVAGKTGTAEVAEDMLPHAWFTGFAPADDPEVAIAILLENSGSIGSEATGGKDAAPVAKEMLEIYFKEIRK